jgi:hypothetical protein
MLQESNLRLCLNTAYQITITGSTSTRKDDKTLKLDVLSLYDGMPESYNHFVEKYKKHINALKSHVDYSCREEFSHISGVLLAGAEGENKTAAKELANAFRRQQIVITKTDLIADNYLESIATRNQELSQNDLLHMAWTSFLENNIGMRGYCAAYYFRFLDDGSLPAPNYKFIASFVDDDKNAKRLEQVDDLIKNYRNRSKFYMDLTESALDVFCNKRESDHRLAIYSEYAKNQNVDGFFSVVYNPLIQERKKHEGSAVLARSRPPVPKPGKTLFENKPGSFSFVDVESAIRIEEDVTPFIKTGRIVGDMCKTGQTFAPLMLTYETVRKCSQLWALGIDGMYLMKKYRLSKPDVEKAVEFAFLYYEIPEDAKFLEPEKEIGCTAMAVDLIFSLLQKEQLKDARKPKAAKGRNKKTQKAHEKTVLDSLSKENKRLEEYAESVKKQLKKQKDDSRQQIKALNTRIYELEKKLKESEEEKQRLEKERETILEELLPDNEEDKEETADVDECSSESSPESVTQEFNKNTEEKRIMIWGLRNNVQKTTEKAIPNAHYCPYDKPVSSSEISGYDGILMYLGCTSHSDYYRLRTTADRCDVPVVVVPKQHTNVNMIAQYGLKLCEKIDRL